MEVGHTVKSEISGLLPQERKINPPSVDELGLSLQEGGGVLFVVSNLTDTAGTLLEAFRIQGITAAPSFLTPGVALIITGGVSGIAALPVFMAGHLRSECGGAEQPTSLASEQQESRCSLTQDDLITISRYGAAYSCAVGGLLDTGGTLVEILKQPGAAPLVGQLGKGLLITSSVLNASGLAFVLGEGAITLNNWLSESPERADPDTRINWDIIKTLKFAGSALFSLGSLLDSVGTLATNFSGAPADNSAQTENSTGSSILTAACVTNLIGLGLYVAAYAVGKYYQTPSGSDVSSSPLPEDTPSENESVSDSLFNWFDSDRYHLAMQSGYPYPY